MPGAIFRLQRRERDDRVVSALDPAAAIGRTANVNDRCVLYAITL
jgi:hypothetical protein